MYTLPTGNARSHLPSTVPIGHGFGARGLKEVERCRCLTAESSDPAPSVGQSMTGRRCSRSGVFDHIEGTMTTTGGLSLLLGSGRRGHPEKIKLPISIKLPLSISIKHPPQPPFLLPPHTHTGIPTHRVLDSPRYCNQTDWRRGGVVHKGRYVDAERRFWGRDRGHGCDHGRCRRHACKPVCGIPAINS